MLILISILLFFIALFLFLAIRQNSVYEKEIANLHENLHRLNESIKNNEKKLKELKNRLGN